MLVPRPPPNKSKEEKPKNQHACTPYSRLLLEVPLNSYCNDPVPSDSSFRADIPQGIKTATSDKRIIGLLKSCPETKRDVARLFFQRPMKSRARCCQPTCLQF